MSTVCRGASSSHQSPSNLCGFDEPWRSRSGSGRSHTSQMPPTRLEEKAMNTSPRQRDDYTGRQIEAARRVSLDVGQILSSFRDSMVDVGGWVPDLLLARTAQNASRKRWRFCGRNSPARIPTARCKSWNFILQHPPMNAPSSQDAHSN
jgi:hypothetical protein